MDQVTTILVFDLNQKPSSSDPSDEEIQDAKLLYYYPEHREVEERRSHFGLIEGLIGMVGSFTTNKIDFLRTKLFVTTISEWCDGVYLVVCFKNDKSKDNETAQYSHHWENFITKVVLEDAKKLFQLVHGPLSDHLEQLAASKEYLDQLRHLFDDILPEFIVNSANSSLSVLNSWNASQKAKMNAECAVEAQFLIQGLCQRFDAVKEFLIIHNKQLIHSSLDMNDMLLLYTYLLKHDGKVCKRQEFRLCKKEGRAELHVMDSETGTPFGPEINLKGRKYHLSVICHADIYLVVLLQAEDVFFTLNNIKEYLEVIPNGFSPLTPSKKEPTMAPNTKTLCVNTASKSIRCIGYENIDEKALKELNVIHGIHQLISSGEDRVNSAHVKDGYRWISAKSSNDRIIYRVIENSGISLTDTKTTFQEFIKQNLGVIYFI
ncbi:hypothetical protein BgAZ_103420 [Babesia gibsoni]|uniref:CCZ1/INTU/HSP4 first Longin domain-containing protein n=1 Tax=Babesia gibsoni TaxID=33632 RepID=A0AAD8PFN7_BABGI|nr:hypothetical protein BgAZ_103420 [Babesia gibsoni]